MKKTFLLIVACVFAFVGAQAQNSEVESTTQMTKVEQFKKNNSFIKETTIYDCKNGGMKIFAKLFTDLNSGEQLTALEIWPTIGSKLLAGGVVAPLGYLDMDRVDDLLLALETILNEANNVQAKDTCMINYTAPGGIDVIYTSEIASSVFGTVGTVIFRKKWYYVDEYGQPTVNYSEASTSCPIKSLPKLIEVIKEAQMIAKQAVEK